MKIVKFLLILFYFQILICCSREREYIFFKTENRDQLRERALKHCHGDFNVLKEEEFGLFTRAYLSCKE